MQPAGLTKSARLPLSALHRRTARAAGPARDAEVAGVDHRANRENTEAAAAATAATAAAARCATTGAAATTAAATRVGRASQVRVAATAATTTATAAAVLAGGAVTARQRIPKIAHQLAAAGRPVAGRAVRDHAGVTRSRGATGHAAATLSAALAGLPRDRGRVGAAFSR
jgi:hypothetical protein